MRSGLCVLGVVALALLVALSSAGEVSSSTAIQATVYYADSSFHLKVGLLDKEEGACWGTYNDSLDDIGWGRLDVHTNSKFDDDVQMGAAGYMEGALLSKRIPQHRANLWEWYLGHYVPGGKFPQKLLDFLAANLQYTRDQAAANAANDAYWANVKMVLSQFDGLVAGYGDHCDPSDPLTEADLWMFNAAGDLLDLAAAVSPSDMRPKWADMTPDEVMHYSLMGDHCSGLVRITDDDLFISQDAWFFYGAMNRVYKHYDFSGLSSVAVAKRFTLSSYPGLLYSFDDFYVTSEGLSFIETTNEIFNTTLYDRVTEKCVLEWVRARVAGHMSSTGAEWASVFSRENSGSYNNQWLILDYKQFQKGNARTQPAGLLWCLEQIPGYIHSDDITEELTHQGYFPSYNIPFFKDIFNISGYQDMVEKVGDFWSYENCPRAQIFRRDAVSVQSLSDMQHMMRYNDFEHDPLSGGDPGNAVCSRYDLKQPGAPRYEMFGGLDTKITTHTDALAMRTHAIASPTYDQQPVWDFSKSPQPVPHRGLPDRWEFPWQTFDWEWADDSE